jgi:hypothetical protein
MPPRKKRVGREQRVLISFFITKGEVKALDSLIESMRTPYNQVTRSSALRGLIKEATSTKRGRK